MNIQLYDLVNCIGAGWPAGWEHNAPKKWLSLMNIQLYDLVNFIGAEWQAGWEYHAPK